jgi:hypothetical protein
MNHLEFKNHKNRQRRFLSQENAVEARRLAGVFKDDVPELTNTQALLSAYVISGRSFLAVNKLKIG